MFRVFVFIFGLCGLLLQGCGSAGINYQGGQSNQDRYNKILKEHFACLESIFTNRPDGYDEVMISSGKDPQIWEKMQSTRLIDEPFIKFQVENTSARAQCNADTYNKLGQLDYRIVRLYADWDSQRESLITQILKGEIKTFGEYNSARHNIETKMESKEHMMFAEINRDIYRAQAELDAERRRQQAEFWNNYNNSQQAYWNAFNQSLFQSTIRRPVTTNCMDLGGMFTCTTQ